MRDKNIQSEQSGYTAGWIEWQGVFQFPNLLRMASFSDGDRLFQLSNAR
jgi:hypothetical protein